MPSPVPAYFDNIMCPDCSPPIGAPHSSISRLTYLSPTFERKNFTPSFPNASSVPPFESTVPTAQGIFSPFCIVRAAIIYIILSPSRIFPSPSSAMSLSLSPSNAI